MESQLESLFVNGATVTISGDDGYEETLEQDNDGRYISPTGAKGTPGTTYTLNITKGDTTCTANCKMPEPASLDSVKIEWNELISDFYLRTAKFFVGDTSANGFYQTIIHTNGEVFKWDLMSNEIDQGKNKYKLIGIMTKATWEDAEEDKKKGNNLDDYNVIYLDDEVVFELRALDENVYKFYSSLDENTNQAINPKSNIEGDGCLGFFSAYYSSSLKCIYTNDDVILLTNKKGIIML